MNEAKRRRRADALARRAGAAPRPESDAAIVERVLALDAVVRATRLAVYRAMPGEPDLAALPARVRAEIYLPVVRDRDQPLEFARYAPGDALARSRFGIDEPLPAAPRLAPDRLDCAIVPAVALDRRGGRLGHGAGYYDLTFAASPRPVLVGVVYDTALVESIETEAWDIAVDFVVTEAVTLRVAPPPAPA